MFPTRYFPSRFFNPRFWVKIGAELIVVGPIISQVIFKTNETTGNIGGKETLGIFREPSDTGRLKP